MDAQKVVEVIYKFFIANMENTYRQLYAEKDWRANNDAYSKAIVNFYSNLTVEQKNQFYTIIKQIGIDQIATLFAIFEGSTYSELDRELVLMDKEGNDYQDLSDYFLEVAALKRSD